jgi:hypothetical protein
MLVLLFASMGNTASRFTYSDRHVELEDVFLTGVVSNMAPISVYNIGSAVITSCRFERCEGQRAGCICLFNIQSNTQTHWCSASSCYARGSIHAGYDTSGAGFMFIWYSSSLMTRYTE